MVNDWNTHKYTHVSSLCFSTFSFRNGWAVRARSVLQKRARTSLSRWMRLGAASWMLVGSSVGPLRTFTHFWFANVVNPIINNHSIPNFTGNRWIDDSSKVLTVLIWRALDILENLGTIQVTRSSPPTFRDEMTHMSREVCDVYGSKLGTSKMQYLTTFNDYIYINIFTQSSNNIAHKSQLIGQWYNCGWGFPIPWWWCDRLCCLRSQSVTWSAVGCGSCARVVTPGLLWNVGGTTLVADELTIWG